MTSSISRKSTEIYRKFSGKNRKKILRLQNIKLFFVLFCWEFNDDYKYKFEIFLACKIPKITWKNPARPTI